MTDVGGAAEGVDLRPQLPSARDQGDVRETCLAFALTSAHEFARAAGAAVVESLSEEAMHWGCKVVDGNWLPTTTFDSAAIAIANTGQPSEEVWPYEPNRAPGVAYAPPTPPSEDWHKAAIEGASILPSALRAELDGGRPVILGVTLFAEFYRPAPDGHIAQPAQGGKTFGGHAVLVVGHAANAFLIRNSWGQTWGLDGYGWLPDSYIELHNRGARVVTA